MLQDQAFIYSSERIKNLKTQIKFIAAVNVTMSVKYWRPPCTCVTKKMPIFRHWQPPWHILAAVRDRSSFEVGDLILLDATFGRSTVVTHTHLAQRGVHGNLPRCVVSV